MAEFDSSITAYIGGDYSGLTEAVTGAEGEIKKLDAEFAGLGANMTKVPQAFAEENKKAMSQILTGEERLQAYREKTAFSRMTDEEKLRVLRAQGMTLLERIGAIEGETVEKTALQLQFEKKKTEIYDLNNKATFEGLTTQKASTAETEDHKTKATGLAGVIESIKKGFKDMGVSIQGAGIGVAFAAFVSLGKEAIANAQKQRDEWEAMGKPLAASTASLARFGDTLDAIKKGAVAAAGSVVSFLTQTGEAYGSIVNRMKGISEADEKIAESSERAAIAMEKRAAATRAEKTDVDKLHAANVALNEAQKEFAESKMNAQGRFNALLADAAELERKIRVDVAAGLDPVKWKTELLEKQKQLLAANINLIEEEASKRIEAIQASAALETSAESKLRAIKAERVVLEEALRKTIEQTGKTSEQTGALEKRIQESIGAELKHHVELIKEQGEARAKLTLEGKEYERLIVLQSKAATERTREERAELEILQLKTKEKEAQGKIEDMLAKRRTQIGAEISAEEDKTLRILVQQRDKITEAINAKTGLAKTVKTELVPAEQAVTSENEKQAALTAAAAVAAAKKLAAARAEADLVPGKSTYTTGSAFSGYGQTFSGGTANYQNMSTAALQGLAAKQDEILNSVDKSGQMIKNASYYSGDIFAKNMAESQKYSIQKELDLRKEIQEYGKRMGDVATIMKYGDAQTERAFRAFTAGADKTNTILERLSEQLSSSGIFAPG